MAFILLGFNTCYAGHSTCTLTAPQLKFNVNFGQLTVLPETPVGSVLGTVAIEPTFQVLGSCTAGTFTKESRFEMDYNNPVSGFQNVYKTNIDGIGIRAQISSSSGSSYLNWILSKDYSSAQAINDGSEMKFELVKIGNVTSAGRLTEGLLVESFWDNKTPQAYYMQNSTIVVPSCSANSSTLNVNLGQHNTADLTGIGSKTADTPVNVSFSCPSSGVGITASIQAEADTTQPGTMKLAGSTSASGIGIQITDGNGSPLQLNTTFTVTSDANTGTYNPGWVAHYIQTGEKISSGSANSTAIVTFNYN